MNPASHPPIRPSIVLAEVRQKAIERVSATARADATAALEVVK